MSELDVVVAQSPAELDGPQARFEWLAENLSHEHVVGADLLLLPELFLTGYNIGSNVNQWCEAVDGTYAQQIAALCQEHNIAIHYGFAESHAGKVYNSANCISREGERQMISWIDNTDTNEAWKEALLGLRRSIKE